MNPNALSIGPRHADLSHQRISAIVSNDQLGRCTIGDTMCAKNRRERPRLTGLPARHVNVQTPGARPLETPDPPFRGRVCRPYGTARRKAACREDRAMARALVWHHQHVAVVSVPPALCAARVPVLSTLNWAQVVSLTWSPTGVATRVYACAERVGWTV